MSLYQFAACVEGWNEAHGGDEHLPAPSPEEFKAARKAHGD